MLDALMPVNRRMLLGALSSVATLRAVGEAIATEPAPIVETSKGRVKGFRTNAIAIFKGIPYGASTAGKGRFRRAKPTSPWPGVRNAIAWGPSAPQGVPAAVAASGKTNSSLSLNDQPTSEDCLYLNVWTPGLADGKARPVMVWLHGGGFNAGNGSWPSTDGTHLAQQGDVVVVTLNHRLNTFGFLYLAELGGDAFADSGNVGMLDIVDALTWVKTNISAFGGDPDNVTIFGESGGGAKVSVLLAMPLAKGLFHKAIIQSGAHLTGLGREESTENARLVMGALGLAPHEVAKLQDASTDAVIAAMITAQRTPGRKPASFSPVKDGRVLKGDPWLEDPPAVSASVPIIVGSTRTETTLLIGLGDPSVFDLDQDSLRAKLQPWLKGVDMETVIKTFSAADAKATPSDIFFAITTDLRVRKQAWKLAEQKISQGRAPIYMYELHFDQDPHMRSPHGMDVHLVFDNVGSGEPVGTQRVAAEMASSWIAFAKTGDPNNGAIPHWPTYVLGSRAVMLFQPIPRAVSRWRDDERLSLASLPVMRVDR